MLSSNAAEKGRMMMASETAFVESVQLQGIMGDVQLPSSGLVVNIRSASGIVVTTFSPGAIYAIRLDRERSVNSNAVHIGNSEAMND
jgi:hypothetical protein